MNFFTKSLTSLFLLLGLSSFCAAPGVIKLKCSVHNMILKENPEFDRWNQEDVHRYLPYPRQARGIFYCGRCTALYKYKKKMQAKNQMEAKLDEIRLVRKKKKRRKG